MSQDDRNSRTVQISVVRGGGASLTSACVVVIEGEHLGKRADIDKRRVLVGRSDEADLFLSHESVSRRHCEFWRDGDDYRVRDLGATNPTQLNGRPVSAAVLKDGDHILVGQCTLKFISATSIEARYHAEVHQLASNDPLTELPNRRHFFEAADREIARCVRTGVPAAMCLVDADHFKMINDRYGHIAGDEVLRHLAHLLREKLRQGDVSGRIGGEEFAVLLPECSAQDAVAVFSEPLRLAVEQAEFTLGGVRRQLTVSIGIAGLTPNRDNRSALMKAADVALYRAKDSGRNRVCVHPGG
jgi:diguanylate cyclase (GGDEF)-like protein